MSKREGVDLQKKYNKKFGNYGKIFERGRVHARKFKIITSR